VITGAALVHVCPLPRPFLVGSLSISINSLGGLLFDALAPSLQMFIGLCPLVL
jgi:hypothetical protein